MRTHYKNLKVSKDAPIEVIKAAYKALTQKHHPDKNGGSEESKRIMNIINESYAVLSDFESRKRHDEWISNSRNNGYDAEQETECERKSHENSRNNCPEGYLTIEEFSRIKGMQAPKVIDMVRSGFYVGKKVDESWYISINEIEGMRYKNKGKKGYQFKWWHFIVAFFIIKALLLIAKQAG